MCKIGCLFKFLISSCYLSIKQILKMLNASVVMVTFFKCTRFFPELKIYKPCQQKVVLVIKTRTYWMRYSLLSLSLILLWWETRYLSRSSSLCIVSYCYLPVDFILPNPKTGQGSVLVLLLSKSLLALWHINIAYSIKPVKLKHKGDITKGHTASSEKVGA